MVWNRRVCRQFPTLHNLQQQNSKESVFSVGYVRSSKHSGWALYRLYKGVSKTAFDIVLIFVTWEERSIPNATRTKLTFCCVRFFSIRVARTCEKHLQRRAYICSSHVYLNFWFNQIGQTCTTAPPGGAFGTLTSSTIVKSSSRLALCTLRMRWNCGRALDIINDICQLFKNICKIRYFLLN